MTLKTLAAAACLSITTATAGLAATFTVNDDEFDVTTITGSFDDNQELLESQVFFGDEDLAFEFATVVGGDLGFPDGFAAPAFAFEVTPDDVEAFVVLSGLGSFDPAQAFGPRGAAFTYAVATPVSAVPLPAGGLLLLSGLGGIAAFQRRKKRAA